MSEQADTGLSELWLPEDTADFISRGRSDDANRVAAPTQRSCCCPSRPGVRVLLPRPDDPTDHVDLLLCAHHYRASRDALARLHTSVTYVGDGLR